MKIEEILKLERAEERNVMHLHKEGIFYRMYEGSAFLFSSLVRPDFKVRKRYYKTIREDVVYLGFPIESLPCYTELRDIVSSREETAYGCRFTMCNSVNLDAFTEWKNCIGGESTKASSGCEPLSDFDELLSRLRNFPLQNSSPMQCINFLAELQDELRKAECL